MSLPIEKQIASAELDLFDLRTERSKRQARQCQAILACRQGAGPFVANLRCKLNGRIGLDGWCLCFAHRAAVDERARVVEMVGPPHAIAEAS